MSNQSASFSAPNTFGGVGAQVQCTTQSQTIKSLPSLRAGLLILASPYRDRHWYGV